MNIYQIEQDHKQLSEMLIENGGELTDDIKLALQINQENMTHKGQGYGLVCRQLEAEVDIINSEIARLHQLKVCRQKTVDRLKETLVRAMDTFQIEKIQTPLMKISIRTSKSVEVEDVKLLDATYVTIKTTVTPDKVAIKKAIESGENVVGAVLKENRNLQIK